MSKSVDKVLMVNNLMSQFNPFLRSRIDLPIKGGIETIENPRFVENIVFQSRGGALDPFEERLADDLMAVFASGAEEIGDVVRGLNDAGSLDRAGGRWTEQSFTHQMSVSAAALFACSEEAA